jgi:hypothetical protein
MKCVGLQQKVQRQWVREGTGGGKMGECEISYKTSDFLSLGLFIPDDGGSTYLLNVGRQSFYTAVQPRRQL